MPPPGQQIHHGPHFPHQAIAQAQAAQMILQNQLNLLQQQLSMNNPMHPSTEQITQMPAQQHQRLAQQMAVQHQHHLQNSHHHLQAPQEQARANAGIQDARNSDHPRHGNPSQSAQPGQAHPSVTSLPFGPTTTTVHEGIGPNGSRMRVIVNETVNYHVSRQGTPVPPVSGTGQQPSASVPFHAPPNIVPNFSSFGALSGLPPPPSFPLQQPNPLIASGRAPSASGHGQHGSSRASQAVAANATAWLLSTPAGPQALVFAPGHGYFSSTPTPTTAQLTNSNRSGGHPSTRHHLQSSNDHVTHTPAQPNNPPIGPAANGENAPPAQAVVRPGEQQRRVNNGENDMFQFIFQRGWLFLRLYIFMLVLSEPGTWRRWFLLAVATIVCLLPRDNPLRGLWNRIRGHIEGLVPIAPAPEQRRQGEAAQNGGEVAGIEGQARPAARRNGRQPSPEQAAARIIRQNQERQNHGLLRDVIFRVERAVALFLASLVPGVGERHVRAREEARREAERIENERLAAEAARADQEAAENESKATPDTKEQRQEMQGEHGATNSAQHSANFA
jgi:hypothetical protein